MPTDVFHRLSEDKKEHIRTTAKGIFIVNGYEKSKVTDICALANIKRRTFYSYFDSLDDLYDYVFDNENASCSSFFDGDNVAIELIKTGLTQDHFMAFKDFYLDIVKSEHGLKKLYESIQGKPEEERLLFNLLISLFKQYELYVLSEEELIEEFNHYRNYLKLD